MELKDVKDAILHKRKVRCGDLTGTPFGCIMRLKHNDTLVCDFDKIKLDDKSKLNWTYLVEVLDKNSHTVYTFDLNNTYVIEK
jgi:hypothetical protein